MKGSKKIQNYCNRHPFVGPVFWIASIQFFLTQIVVALFWPTRYSLSQHTISDLGNTVCGVYVDRYVCSPLYSWMNASFIVLGITMVVGSALIYHEFRKSVASLVGFSFMGLAGIGTILVGLFPENTIGFLHAFGAFLPFFIGNLALLILGVFLHLTPLFRFYTIFSGIISLAAFLLLITHNYLGIGIGGMERLTAHPQTIWLIIFGLYVSMNLYRSHSPMPAKAKRLL